MPSIAELAQEPSPENWRLLCQALDQLPVPEATEAIASIETALAKWPDELRATMCGMTWDDEFFAGRPNPRSSIVRYLRFDRIFTGRYDHSMRLRPDLTAQQIRALGSAAGVQHLTRINFNYQHDGNTISALADGNFAQLRIVELSGAKVGTGRCLAELGVASFFPQLERLEVTSCDITAETVAALFLPQPGPREIHLSSNDLGAAGAAVIAKQLRATPTRLVLSSCKLGDQGCEELAAIREPLEALDLDANEITDRGLAALVGGTLKVKELSIRNGALTTLRPLISATWPLTKLFAGSNALDDKTAALLAKSAPETLQELELADNDITAKGLAALLDSPHLAELRVLDISANRIGAFTGGGATLGKLENLSLSNNRLGDGIRALAAISSDALVTLHLDNNNIDVRALEELTGASWFGRLTTLNLSDNPLGPGAGVVFGAWPIEKLMLSNTRLGDRGALAMFDTGMQPTDLDLEGCDLTDEAIVYLAKSPTLAKIETLSLANNAITERGIRALYDAKPARLRQLKVGNNRIDDDAAYDLAKWDQLFYVDVDGNPIGKRAETAIETRPVRCCP